MTRDGGKDEKDATKLEAVQIVRYLSASLQRTANPKSVNVAGNAAGAILAIAAALALPLTALSPVVATTAFSIVVLAAQQIGRFFAIASIRRSKKITPETVCILHRDLRDYGVRPEFIPLVAQQIVRHAPDAIFDARRILSALSPAVLRLDTLPETRRGPGQRLSTGTTLPVQPAAVDVRVVKDIGYGRP